MIINKLAKQLSEVKFIEFEPTENCDLAGDIDYFAHVGTKAFGIQIKPVTAKANFGNYSATERMKASFRDFEDQYGGKVFVVFSIDDEIENIDVLIAIEKEIERLKKLK